MRPRHMCLGKHLRERMMTLNDTGFNEAEAHVPRKTALAEVGFPHGFGKDAASGNSITLA